MQEKWRKSDQEGKCYIIGSENNLNCISVVIDTIYEYFLHRGPSHLVPSEVMCQNEKISQRMTLQIVFVMTVRAFLPTASNNIHEKN